MTLEMTYVMRASIPAAIRSIIEAEALVTFPSECCGVLVGRRLADSIEIAQAKPSKNVATQRATDRFEIDPKTLFELHRTLRDGPDQIVGYYHSHPNGEPKPSVTDQEGASEPEMIWLIAATDGKSVSQISAHVTVAATDGVAFAPVAIDWL
jgi:proteasome lid subunit RPN8/RPN11